MFAQVGRAQPMQPAPSGRIGGRDANEEVAALSAFSRELWLADVGASSPDGSAGAHREFPASAAASQPLYDRGFSPPPYDGCRATWRNQQGYSNNANRGAIRLMFSMPAMARCRHATLLQPGLLE